MLGRNEDRAMVTRIELHKPSGHLPSMSTRTSSAESTGSTRSPAKLAWRAAARAVDDVISVHELDPRYAGAACRLGGRLALP